MDYSDYTSIAQHHHRHRQHLLNRQDNRHPSFSSTLLDQIYKSIDDSSANSTIKTKKHHHQNQNQNQHRTGSLNDKTVANRYETGFLTDDFVRSRNQKITEPIFFKQHSTSSSSDSSGFSSSESDSFYKRSKSVPHPKPIRTTIDKSQPQQQPQGSFLRTKSKASKIYADLKKVKQPISPGGRLATFLNTIFTKKPAKINTRATTVESSSSITTCSSASSFSRSCLSKTPSSTEKSKRSVRFMDEECIQKDRELIRKAVEIRVMEENRRVIEAAKELLRTYQKSKDEDEEEDDEDDLFELDHLSVIGIEKFREELPVYETTRLNTHRIISR